MSKNFIAPGDKLTVTAPYSVTSGQGVLVGSLFGVAQHDAANGAPVVIDRNGVWDLPKEAPLVISQGDRLFWDNTNRRLTKTATRNFQVSVATGAALSADTTVRSRIERIPVSGA